MDQVTNLQAHWISFQAEHKFDFLCMPFWFLISKKFFLDDNSENLNINLYYVMLNLIFLDLVEISESSNAWEGHRAWNSSLTNRWVSIKFFWYCWTISGSILCIRWIWTKPLKCLMSNCASWTDDHLYLIVHVHYSFENFSLVWHYERWKRTGLTWRFLKKQI